MADLTEQEIANYLATYSGSLPPMVEEKVDYEKPIQLYTGPAVDTTDRSMVGLAQSQRFDPVGFRSEDPMRKNIFYVDPFITCSNCNLMQFVDVVTIRRMLALPLNVARELKLADESLPPCLRCLRVDCFVIGSHDFSDLIAAREAVAKAKREAEAAAVRAIQRSYRAYLRKMYGSAVCGTFLAERYLRETGAIKIQSYVRGRLGRRRAATERCLRIIKSAHPLLIRNSLKTVMGKPKVFWYKREVEKKLVFRNYLELCDRLGFIPPRKTVEDNIKEISLRIIARQHRLILLIQCRWRGFMIRRIFQFFKSELFRLFEKTASFVMKIQRTYRAHAVRLSMPKFKADHRNEKLMESYLQSTAEQSTVKTKQRFAEKIRNEYKLERQEEKTLRVTAKIPLASEYGGSRLKSYWDSCYSTDRLSKSIDEYLAAEQTLLDNESDELHGEIARKEFVGARIAQLGPAGYGNRTLHDQLLATQRAKAMEKQEHHARAKDEAIERTRLEQQRFSKGLPSGPQLMSKRERKFLQQERRQTEDGGGGRMSKKQPLMDPLEMVKGLVQYENAGAGTTSDAYYAEKELGGSRPPRGTEHCGPMVLYGSATSSEIDKHGPFDDANSVGGGSMDSRSYVSQQSTSLASTCSNAHSLDLAAAEVADYYNLDESTRKKGMRLYFEKERTDLSMKFADRMKRISDRVVRDSLQAVDPDRPSMADRFRDHNQRRGIYDKRHNRTCMGGHKGGSELHGDTLHGAMVAATAKGQQPVNRPSDAEKRGGPTQSQRRTTRLRDAMLSADSKVSQSSQGSMSWSRNDGAVDASMGLADGGDEVDHRPGSGNHHKAAQKKKPVFKNVFLDSSQRGRPSKINTTNVKYPPNLNFNSMDWLFSDES